MKNKIKIVLMIISYISLLLLFMPSTKTGIVLTALCMIAGSIVIYRRRIEIRKNKELIFVIPFAVALSAYFGYSFYNIWIYSSAVGSVAAIVHMSKNLFVGTIAACLSFAACYIILFVLQKTTRKAVELLELNLFIRDIFCCLIMAVATVVFGQKTVYITALSMGLLKFVLCVLIVSVPILLLYCLTGKMHISAVVGTGLFMIIFIINAYVFKFRGRVVEPIDIFSAGTAMNVAGNYSLLPIPVPVCIAFLLWCSLIAFVFYICLRKKYKPQFVKRISLVVFCAVSVCAIVCYIPNVPIISWRRDGAKMNGYVLDFVSKIKEVHVSKPDGYSKDNVDNVADQYTVDVDPDRKPHIIVIMNEAFSDLNAVGELSTNEEVMPFISSLKENTVSGYALASVYGGNTSNSEFEFLTGNSMAYLSPNAVPYQQYIKSPSYSAVSYLKGNYGYKCIAMHPYLSDGWNRPDTYSNFGFDKCLFVDNFPQKDYVREYISDREMYEKIVSEYEENKQDPMFIFGVSMQNHGGYDYNGKNYEQTVSLKGMNGSYPDAEQYLSLIRETDKATEYLISYFSNVDDDVVIVFFGDHQPRLSDAFYSELGGEADTLDKQQNKYKVPFFVWANYDIEEEYVECTSLNYLSTYMYEAAKIPLPAYNQFLSELEDVIPSMNPHGYYSNKKGCYVSFDEASDDEKIWLDKYEQLQYNNLFDKKNCNGKLFPVLNKE